MPILYHGTSDVRLKGIKDQGLARSEECPVRQFSCPPGIYLAQSITEAMFFAESAVEYDTHFLKEDPSKHRVAILRMRSESIPSDCCVQFDNQFDGALRLSNCTSIPPRAIEVCELPARPKWGSSPAMAQIIRDACDWHPLQGGKA